MKVILITFSGMIVLSIVGFLFEKLAAIIPPPRELNFWGFKSSKYMKSLSDNKKNKKQ